MHQLGQFVFAGLSGSGSSLLASYQLLGIIQTSPTIAEGIQQKAVTLTVTQRFNECLPKIVHTKFTRTLSVSFSSAIWFRSNALLGGVDVDLSQPLYYFCTALKCCHRHNSPSISNRHLCTHIPDIFLFFGWTYSCIGRSLQSRAQRKFLVVCIKQIINQNSTYALASFIGTHHSAWKSLRKPSFSALWCSLVELYRRVVTLKQVFLHNPNQYRLR